MSAESFCCSVMAAPSAMRQLTMSEIARRHALDGRAPVLVAVLHLGGSGGSGSRPGRRRGRCAGCVWASVTVRVEALPAPARTPPAVVAPGCTTTMLVPRLSSCFFTARAGAVADRHHGDQRGHADEDAEHGQGRAQLVALQRLQRGRERPSTGRPRRGRESPSGSGGAAAGGLAALAAAASSAGGSTAI